MQVSRRTQQSTTFAARLAPVGAGAAPVGAKVASVEIAPATDGSASAPAETKVVPVGEVCSDETW